MQLTKLSIFTGIVRALSLDFVEHIPNKSP